jgi:hypothetical protein
VELVKKTDDYSIYQKRSKRYAVRDANYKWVGGDEKVKILLKEKLIKAAAPKPKPAKEDSAAEAPAEAGKEKEAPEKTEE